MQFLYSQYLFPMTILLNVHLGYGTVKVCMVFSSYMRDFLPVAPTYKARSVWNSYLLLSLCKCFSPSCSKHAWWQVILNFSEFGRNIFKMSDFRILSTLLQQKMKCWFIFRHRKEHNSEALDLLEITGGIY